MKKLDHRVARSTMANTLRANGIRPSPERPMAWRTFLRAHAAVVAATDFSTVEVWTARGLVTHFHRERPHQGLGNELIAPEPSNDSPTGEIIGTERLGGLLCSYQRAA